MASSRTETESETDEAARLAALMAYGVLDTPPEAEFDDIVLLARTFCDTPMALVSLVGADRQWFKARAGIELTETPINQSVCAHAIREREILVIPDLTLDPRTRDNPLVTGQAHMRFYAGAVLRTPRGEAIGALCVIDTTPRPGGLTPEQTGSLLALGRQTMAMLQFRRALRSRDNAARLQLDRAQAVDSAQQAGGIGTFEIDVDSNSLRASPVFCRLFGLPPTPSMDAGVIEAIVIPEDRDKVSTLATRSSGTTVLETEYRIRRANDGELRWLSRRGEFERDAAGRPLLLRGVVHDITERKQVEMAQETLNSEISHRIKNTLAIVDAIALQTLRHAADQTAVQNFSRRLQALGRAHDILIGRSLAGADLQATVTAVTGVIADPGRFAMSGPVGESDPAVWHRQIAISLTTAYLSTRAFMAALRRGRGSIVYFGAAAVLPGGAVGEKSAYAAAKAGVLALMQAVSQEEQKNGVRANAIAPTMIRTALNESEMGANRNYVERESVADVVRWLCSDAARDVTGQTIRLGS